MVSQETTDLMKILARENDDKYNMMKVIEENLELSEILVKKINKIGRDKEPSEQEIIDEIGDNVIRLGVLSQMYGADKVRERVDYKTGKLISWLRSGKYDKNC